MNSHLSPAETAKRFGISIKALRLYEQRGLLKPLRAANGSTGAAWRVYGPDQVARLHQILALKRLGLSLEEAKALTTSGDATTAAALDFARRFRATGRHLKSSAPSPLTALRPKLKAMMDDAPSDPHASQK
jgi:DNA-binding transcriptional MerR regulator